MRNLTAAWALGILLGSSASAAPVPAVGGPLNVIVLDICTIRAQHLSSAGYDRKTTPGLDALARKGIVFTQMWGQSSWCLPNYASLFTGHVPEVHGLYFNLPFRELPAFETTLAEKMRGAGYRTGGFTGGVYFLPAWGLSRGFDTFSNRFSSTTALPGRFSGTAPHLLEWIGREPGKPFFAYATVDDMHTPYQSDDPEVFDPGYEGVAHSTEVLNIRFFRAYNGEPLEPGDPLVETLRRFRADPRALHHLTAHYDAALKQADRSISDFLAKLKERGLWDRTIVVVTGDHGELLGEKGLLGHTESLYEPILRVPLIVHHPRYKHLAGRRFDELVQRLDIMPTVLDEAGVPTDGLELQGRSLLPLLEGTVKGQAFRRYAFASSKRNMARRTDFEIDERAVRDERWKLHWYRYKDRFELYDLKKDPGEKRDQSAAHPEIAGRLAFELMNHFETSRPHEPGLPSGARPDQGFAPSVPLH